MYVISDYTKEVAKKLGLLIFSSENRKKKLEVYDKATGKFIGYLGDSKYMDYFSYLEQEKLGKYPRGYADERRRLYFNRHHKDIENIGSKGFLVWRLLWAG